MVVFRHFLPVVCFFFCLALGFIGCGEETDEVVDDTPNSDPLSRIPYAQDSVVHYPESVYARVYQMNSSPGAGYIDVTITGETGAVEAEVVIQAVVLVSDILLIPIAQIRAYSGHPLMTPYKKSLRIDGLKKGEYHIYLLGTHAETLDDHFIIAEKVEVK